MFAAPAVLRPSLQNAVHRETETESVQIFTVLFPGPLQQVPHQIRTDLQPHRRMSAESMWKIHGGQYLRLTRLSRSVTSFAETCRVSSKASGAVLCSLPASSLGLHLALTEPPTTGGDCVALRPNAGPCRRLRISHPDAC